MKNAFSNWSESDVVRHNARVSNAPIPALKAKSSVIRESDLHSQIFDECRRRGWIAFHGAMSERTHRTAGEPDFIILKNNGAVLFVECKSASGKLSTDQQVIKSWAEKLGHSIHIVRSLEEFLHIIK